MTNLGTENGGAAPCAEEAEHGQLDGLIERARMLGGSSQVHPGGGGQAGTTGQTIRPEAEAQGMGCTPLSTPGPRSARANQRISNLARRSTVAKGTCSTCLDSRVMTSEEKRMYPGWTRICKERKCGVCDGDGCAKHGGVV